MASDALLMEGVSSFYRILPVNQMAFPAGFRLFSIILPEVVTIHTIISVPVLGRMHFVVEQDISCRAFQHDSNRLIRGFDREGRVADHTHNQKTDGKTIGDDFFCFQIHPRLPFLMAKMMARSLNSVHPEMGHFRMELTAYSGQRSANASFFRPFAESRTLIADRANP